LTDGRLLVVAGSPGAIDPFIGQPGFADVRVEIYDPAANSWAPAASTASPRSGHSATLMPDGRVLVAGGDGTSSQPNPTPSSSEVFDPSSNSWSGMTRMLRLRGGHGATAISAGKVLVIGGGGDSSTPTSAERYPEQVPDPPPPTCPSCAGPPPGVSGDGVVPPVLPAVDRSAPAATIAGTKRQKLGRSVSATVTCGSVENCIASATGKMSVPGVARPFKLKAPKKTTIALNRRVTLKLGLPAKARAAAARALRARRKVRVTVTVKVSDVAANVRTLKLAIQLRK
jgi:hypothetical protein